MGDNPQFLSRICWNSEGWTHPTGEAARTESKTYAAREGFGHEEWLFSPKATATDGWRYAYLQPVHDSQKTHEGESIDIWLYTISPTEGRCYAGILRGAEVLNEKSEDYAWEQFNSSNLLSEMVKQVNSVRLDKRKKWGKEDMTFNIRYRPEMAERYDPPVKALPNAQICRLPPRYKLYRLDEHWKEEMEEWHRRLPSSEPRPTEPQQRRGTGEIEASQLHNRLQNNLVTLLRVRYGDNNVVSEQDFVDIKLTRGNETVFIEVKSESQPMYAIREALGQLLEYAYAAQQRGGKVTELVIAAPGELSDLERGYIEHLRTDRKLPVRYLRVSLEMTEVDL